MIVKVDSREHEGKNLHVLNWFDLNGIEWIPKVTLPTGDYMAHGNDSITVDRKSGLLECYQNVICDHDRFRNECLRAREKNMRLVVLIEESGINGLSDVHKWQNPRRIKWEQINQRHCLGKSLNVKIAAAPPKPSDQLQTIMETMSRKYGVEWAFCSKSDCGARIVEILGGK